MKTTRIRKRIFLSVILVFLTACATEQTGEQPKQAPVSAAAPMSPQPVTRPTFQSPVLHNVLRDPANVLSKRSVYYAYDKYDVTSEYRPLVEAHAKYLRDHPGATLTIEGNCDERGSREFNLALGQRRADNVKKMMTLLGVPDRQIDTVSFGEEKPKATGHDEAAWAQNRRSDIVYVREN